MRIHCQFVPPQIVDHLARASVTDGLDPSTVQRAAVASERLRTQRRYATNASLATLRAPQPGKADRQVYDDLHDWKLDATPVWSEGDPPAADANVRGACEALRATRDFYREILGRDSIDGAGCALVANVNFGVDYPNAFWDGERMVFGNGDGVAFRDLTADLDVPGHELTHGVVQHTAGLEYTDQPGALNESFADVMGVCVDQYVCGQDAGEHNWLVGDQAMAEGVYGEAIRSLAHPGTAYDNKIMGRDPQAAHMTGYVPAGDPHVNSGIPNRAFHLAAVDLGTFPAARIWYAALQNLWPKAQFADAAYVCSEMARMLARDGVVPRKAPQTVRAAFHDVGIG
jgi:Zn-dependent metalloprotease